MSRLSRKAATSSALSMLCRVHALDADDTVTVKGGRRLHTLEARDAAPSLPAARFDGVDTRFGLEGI